MIKYASILALALALGACSSDSNDTDDVVGGVVDPIVDMVPGNTDVDTGNTDTGNTDTGNTDTGNTDTNTGATGSGGGTPGVWFGNNGFGEGVMVIDNNENVFTFADNGVPGDNRFEVVFGPSSEELQRFIHRDSSLAASTSFTLVGQPPSDVGAPGVDTLTYVLNAENGGQQITNTGTSPFTMTFATSDDVAPIALADIAGTWGATTSFAEVDGNLSITMSFTATGDISGSTEFNQTGPVTLAGSATAPAGVNQYLSVSYVWNGLVRNGVVFRSRTDTNGLILSSFGPSSNGGSESFTARLFSQ